MTPYPLPDSALAPAPPAPPAPRRPGWLVPLLAAVALVLVAATAVTTWALTRASSATPTSTAATPAAAAAPPRSASIECVTIDRAYKAWDSSIFLPRNIARVLAMEDAEFDLAGNDAKGLADATADWPDQPAKDLAFAAATVPVELGLARIMALGDGVDDEQAGKIVSAIDATRTAYLAWRTATCL